VTILAGVDLGGTKVQAVVLRDGERVGQARLPTPPKGSNDEIVQACADTATQAFQEAGIEPSEAATLGLGAPGQTDEDGTTLLAAPNLPGVKGPLRLAELVAEKVGVGSAFLTNDVRAGLIGEHRAGAGRPFQSLVGVWCGTGVGGGIILNGEVWRGRGAAGEIGHIVVRRGGAQCGCGNLGCLEAYAGRAQMEARARREYEDGEKTVLFEIQKKKKRPHLTSGVWAEALDDGDELARRLIDRAILALAAGIGSVQNLLDVEAVIIGGGLGDKLGDPFVRRIEKQLPEHLLLPDRAPKLLGTELGDLGGATGAALLAGDRISVAA
jgi:glucokinase